jgi:transposase
MLIHLHKNATTTPATRRAIQQASGTDAELAAQFGVGRLTIRKWRKRGTTEDGSHTPHRLQTTLNAGQEEIVVYLRTQLRLSLDDLLAAVREFIEPAMSRSALDRLLRRRGINRLPEPEVTPTQVKSFKAYEPGYVHMDVKYLPQMQDETTRRYVFVAIDRATRWVFIAIKSHKTAASARAFLNALHKAAPFKITTLLSDNGREFTDRAFGRREKDASGAHEFDALCEALGIEHRLIRPKHPQTFDSAHDLQTTLHRFVWLYNEHLPQRALNAATPVQSLKQWQASHPHLFSKRVVNHPGPDTYPTTPPGRDSSMVGT